MVISIDDQPISATFFNEGKWLTEFVTPDSMEIQELYKELTRGISDRINRAIALHKWVSQEIRYKPFIKAVLRVDNKTSVNLDTWLDPSITRRVKVGNCANKSFLLASLLRNEFDPGEVHVVLGNLHNKEVGGHAWLQLKLGDRAYIMESTRADVQALVPAVTASRYEAVHFFNDKTAYAIEGRTVMTPMTRCYSTWLSDYLNWAYIESKKGSPYV